ncbi:MAG: VOC family protein [Actinomycetota bacterium]
MGHPVVHFEIIGEGARELGSFYSEVFEWKLNFDNSMNYGIVDTGSVPAGGIGEPQGGLANRTTLYIQVPDINKTLEQVGGLGGKTVMARTEIPGAVTMALFEDPRGNLIGLVEG